MSLPRPPAPRVGIVLFLILLTFHTEGPSDAPRVTRNPQQCSNITTVNETKDSFYTIIRMTRVHGNAQQNRDQPVTSVSVRAAAPLSSESTFTAACSSITARQSRCKSIDTHTRFNLHTYTNVHIHKVIKRCTCGLRHATAVSNPTRSRGHLSSLTASLEQRDIIISSPGHTIDMVKQRLLALDHGFQPIRSTQQQAKQASTRHHGQLGEVI